MADYMEEASAGLENVPANSIINSVSIDEYSMDQALEALDVVEDWMNWVVFGVGGPA